MLSNLMWLCGMIGSLAFSFNLMPIVVKCYKTKDCETITNSFLVLAYAGNLFSCAFVVYTNYTTGLWQYPIFFNYGMATLLTSILTVMKIKYKK